MSRPTAGDRVVLDCGYDNDTGHQVGFGTSTLDEMCFVSVTLYPAQNRDDFLCSN